MPQQLDYLLNYTSTTTLNTHASSWSGTIKCTTLHFIVIIKMNKGGSGRQRSKKQNKFLPTYLPTTSATYYFTCVLFTSQYLPPPPTIITTTLYPMYTKCIINVYISAALQHFTFSKGSVLSVYLATDHFAFRTSFFFFRSSQECEYIIIGNVYKYHARLCNRLPPSSLHLVFLVVSLYKVV